ncbi:SDR family oxidoreductase [Pseudomonas shahriarae]|uniref:SDR family oxidoreductase n=1 Tax=Pseudomonas shahriarae TaxID=2745512 RepID=A0A9X4HBE7_9PSED|nr:SDR family oxidoreductase [Pseudomonas shahriarae]MDD1009915.1 SDR family oxidoreductase [Pseudomonas shahriarae]
MNEPHVLVTGATGLVGEAVVFRLLRDRKFAPIAAVRSESRLSGLCRVVPFDLDDALVQPSLSGVQVVVHCAARVHVMNDSAADVLEEYRRVNVDGTVRLARMAAQVGVERFIYISSVKVNGEMTPPGVSYKASDAPAPVDPYGISKREAEDALRQISIETGMQVVIIRPPLVYGPGVKANFLSMMRWLVRGVPLPLGAIHNKRSMVSIGNLVDLINICITHPQAAGNVFLVSDGEDFSTSQLLVRMAVALKVKARLLAVPSWALTACASLIGRRDIANRLCGSLQVDISETFATLGWQPVINTDAALQQTAEHYLAQARP